MDVKLRVKNIIIVGGASGIGYATAPLRAGKKLKNAIKRKILASIKTDNR